MPSPNLDQPLRRAICPTAPLAYGAAMQADREFELVTCLCRAAWSGEAVQECPSTAGIELDRLAAIAARHRVEAIVSHGLGRAGLPIPPALGDATRNAARDHLRAIAASAQLSQAFATSGIDHLFVKGVTLAARAWPNPALKTSADIDLLVRPKQVEQAGAVLDRNGFRVIEPARRSELGRWHGRRKESLWVRDDGCQVDLHTSLVDHPALLDLSVIDAPRQRVEVAPGIDLPTLNDELTYAYLCVHGAWSCWFRLKWIADLAAWLSLRSGKVEQYHAFAARVGAGRASAQALLLIDHLFALEGHSTLIQQLSADPIHLDLRDRAMAQLVGRRDLAEPLDRRFGTFSIRAAQLKLLPDWMSKLAEVARQTGDIVDRRFR